MRIHRSDHGTIAPGRKPDEAGGTDTAKPSEGGRTTTRAGGDQWELAKPPSRFERLIEREVDGELRASSAQDRATVGLSAQELESSLRTLWAECLDQTDVEPDTPFVELGGHSLHAVELHVRIGDELGIAVPLEELLRAPTVRAQVELLGRYQRSPATV